MFALMIITLKLLLVAGIAYFIINKAFQYFISLDEDNINATSTGRGDASLPPTHTIHDFNVLPMSNCQITVPPIKKVKCSHVDPHHSDNARPVTEGIGTKPSTQKPSLEKPKRKYTKKDKISLDNTQDKIIMDKLKKETVIESKAKPKSKQKSKPKGKHNHRNSAGKFARKKGA